MASYVPGLSDILPGWLSVRDFGARGNGAADDTTAIQAALTAVPAGTTLYFPLGDYRADALNFVASGVTLVGGPGTVLRKIDGSSNAPLLHGVSLTNLTVRDLAIDGRGPQQSFWNPDPYAADNVVFADGVRFTGGSGNRVVNCRLVNCGAAGVRWRGSPGGLADGLTGSGNGFGTVVLYRLSGVECFGSLVRGCVLSADFCDPIRVVTNDVRVAGNDVRDVTNMLGGGGVGYAGIYTEDADRVVVKGNVVANVSGHGIDLGGAGGGEGNVVADNAVRGAALCGILTVRHGTSVTGNTCTDNGSRTTDARRHGIQIDTRCTATGNVCRDTRAGGSRTQQYGVTVAAGATGVVVVGNALGGNVLGAVNDLGTGSVITPNGTT